MCMNAAPHEHLGPVEIRSPGSRVTDSCKLPCGCWKSNQLIWKNSQCSEILNHLFGPDLIYLFFNKVIWKVLNRLIPFFKTNI